MRGLTLILGAFLVGCAVGDEPNRQPRVIWEDNFDTIDRSKWRHLVTGSDNGNAEFQYYRDNRKNSFTEGGILNICPTPTSDERSDYDMYNTPQSESDCNLEPCVITPNPTPPKPIVVKPVYSARLDTYNKFTVKYGRVEFRAQIPRGDWIWPALWLMPNDDSYGGWPASGELDVMESRGNRNYIDGNGKQQGTMNVGSTLHFGPYWPFDGWGWAHYETQKQGGGDWSDDFHVYAVDWTPNRLTFSIDGVETGSSPTPPKNNFWDLGNFPDLIPGGQNPWAGGDPVAPFDKPFYIILNVAIAGGFFPPDWKNENGQPWDLGSGMPWTQWYLAEKDIYRTWDRPCLKLDYVRVLEN